MTASGSPVPPEKLVAFVEMAYEYAQEHGQEAALREFNNPTGRFVEGELYIFAYDTRANTLALPFQPDLLGKNRWNVTDANGRAFIREIVETAQSGGGFVHYLYSDPSDNFKIKTKLSYVMMVDQGWLIGSGIYEAQRDEPIVRVGGEMSADDLAAFVQNASAYVTAVGEHAALAEFSRKDGTFSRGDVYVYAYDYNGTLLAHPNEPDLVGTNRLNWTDIRGLPVFRVGAFTASSGGGFIAYLYPAAKGGIIDEKALDTYEPKIAYAFPTETSWIGSEMYLADMLPEGSSRPQIVRDMTRLVERCAVNGREKGSAITFAEISNRSGMFVDAQGHYIYAYDYNGTLLAHPYLPEKIGSNLINRRDLFGMENIRALANTAHSGGGYVVFIWPNPGKGNREDLKIGYVLPVDDAWWVGSGVYLSEITGTDASLPSSVP